MLKNTKAKIKSTILEVSPIQVKEETKNSRIFKMKKFELCNPFFCFLQQKYEFHLCSTSKSNMPT